MEPLTPQAALLQALVSGDGYALELSQRVHSLTGRRLTLKQGSLYPALRALEREGLATSYQSRPLPERGGRPRRYYRLTAEGRRVARDARVVYSAMALATATGAA